ncbi:MAG: copper chaperone PCu(A)C [Rhodospirillales bacterium]
MKRGPLVLALTVAFTIVTSAMARDVHLGSLTVSHPWARASAGKAKAGAAYVTITNDGRQVDRLVKVASPIAGKARLHTHMMEGHMMKMRPVEAIGIGPGKPAVLKPGGLHIMLMGLKSPLKQGETFPMTLTFEKAGAVEVRVMVKKVGAMGAGRPSCHVPVHLSEEAERQPGGALYAGPAMKHRMPQPQPMAGMTGSHADMKGTHMVHKPQYGGAFFMAPDKIHHLEGLYSDECGFQVIFYNAFTRPIRADRFQAFIKVIPRNEDEPEVIRFLSSSEDHTVLKSAIGDEVRKPFLIELLVKFPESDEPELFTIQVPG